MLLRNIIGSKKMLSVFGVLLFLLLPLVISNVAAARPSNVPGKAGKARTSTCTYSISPSSRTHPVAGGTGTVNVTADSGCSWVAVSNDPTWITLTSGSAGVGNGTVSYSVQSNPGGFRAGSITIAGQTFSVGQDANCTYTISPTNRTISAAGGSGTVSVTTSILPCGWTAVSNDPTWIHVDNSGPGVGSGTVTYSVQSNPGGFRAGSITIAGQTFTIGQDANCTYTISPTSQSTSGVSHKTNERMGQNSVKIG